MRAFHKKWQELPFHIKVFSIVIVLLFGGGSVALSVLMLSSVMDDNNTNDSTDDNTDGADSENSDADTSSMRSSPCESTWDEWGKCDCLTGTQTRQRLCHPDDCDTCPTEESEERKCTPNATDCADWYKLKNTYISDGEYIRRTPYMSSEKACYQQCEADANCAAVYVYKWPEGEGARPGSFECSQIAAPNVHLLCDRQGSMSNFHPDNRTAWINQRKAGDYFKPKCGKAMMGA